jgi:hypothetical protein
MRYSELERLVCAGAISKPFREQLMMDPHQAAQAGYLGQPFQLDPEELDLIATIQVGDFQQFAEQIGLWIAAHRNGYPMNGNGNGHGHGSHYPT